MLYKTGLHNWFFSVAGLALLSGCSFFYASTEPSGSQPSAWHYEKELTVPTLPDDLEQLTHGKATIKAQCHFSPELVKAFHENQKMILMPFLTPMPDGSLGPDLNGSRSVYQSLGSYVNLASRGESVQFFQRWVSSAEQACPANLNRTIQQCSLKKLYSVTKWWGEDKARYYDFARLNVWLEQRPEVDFVILPFLSALNSDAARNLRYSTNSAPIVNMSSFERISALKDYLGRPSMNWVALTEKSNMPDELTSAGGCSLVWQELEALKASGQVNYQELVLAEETLRPLLLHFIESHVRPLTFSEGM